MTQWDYVRVERRVVDLGYGTVGVANYSYKVIGGSAQFDTADDAMRAMGDEGWELCAVTEGRDFMSYACTLYFKRPRV